AGKTSRCHQRAFKARSCRARKRRFMRTLRGGSIMSDLIYGVGRVLVAIIFVVSGVNHFMGVQGFSDNIAAANFPLPAQIEQYLPIGKDLALAYLVAGVEAIAGVLILAGLLTRLAAVVLFVFCGLTIYFVHHFWDMQAPAQAANQIQALKNLAVMGG